MEKRDTFGIDSNKIDFHPDRIKQFIEAGSNWELAKKIYPIYVEVTPSGACNHRCTFCAVDYIGYKTRFLDEAVLGERLAEMAESGVKSVMYAGEGEPLLHKQIGKIIAFTKGVGIDAAITTNATCLTESLATRVVPHATWIKASINAGTADSYAEIHQTNANQFEMAWRNMGVAARIRNGLGLNPVEHTLGAQMVLLPENAEEAVAFAQRAKNEGLDYAIIKPYSQHNMSLTRRYEGTRYEEYLTMKDELESLNSDVFHVVFRDTTMAELNQPRQVYDKCQSTPHFWAYIMGNGDVYGCSAYLEDQRFCYGNIYEQTFREIWEGERRRENFAYVNDGLDISECRRNCRMHKVNERLWEIKQEQIPMTIIGQTKDAPPHVNFI